MNIESLYAPTDIDPSTIVGRHSVIGYPKEERLRTEQRNPGSASNGRPVSIRANCLIGNHAIIHEGVQVGDDCVIEDRVRIGYDSTIGDGTRIVYGAYICDRVTIGASATVAGFICDGTTIGDRSTVMGELVHEYTRPHEGWWDVDEEPPVIEADTVIGYGAHVIGGVHIGPHSYIAAGAVVTKDVPPEHIVTDVNNHTPTIQWTGRRLQSLIRHWQARPSAQTR
ncbi:DapH/DapD/GlmU-related protein [Nocardioides sp. NPDC000445]|uniref:DapH/DapD/GlmU-related protein n=1 Tax=Nocardioides sp. NPDC000445 TaxID=3154257 RepID=UPI00331AAFFD